jgi:DNA-binding HxlR family transcriptional regulator
VKKNLEIEKIPEVKLKRELRTDIELEEPRFVFSDRHEKLLKIISRSGVCTILFTLEMKPMKFSELMFATKLNPGVVDRHLKCLVDLRIIERKENKYQLTETGRNLIPVIEEFLNIMDRI